MELGDQRCQRSALRVCGDRHRTPPSARCASAPVRRAVSVAVPAASSTASSTARQKSQTPTIARRLPGAAPGTSSRSLYRAPLAGPASFHRIWCWRGSRRITGGGPSERTPRQRQGVSRAERRAAPEHIKTDPFERSRINEAPSHVRRSSQRSRPRTPSHTGRPASNNDLVRAATAASAASHSGPIRPASRSGVAGAGAIPLMERHVQPPAFASRSRNPARSSSAEAPCTKHRTGRRAAVVVPRNPEDQPARPGLPSAGSSRADRPTSRIGWSRRPAGTH